MTVVAGQEGRGLPAPLPPPIDSAQDGDDYRDDKGLLDHLWDIIAVHGPDVPRADVKKHATYRGLSSNWRNYVRFHQDTISKNDHKKNRALLDKADEWAFDHELDVGVWNGYLSEKDGLLTAVVCPPSHAPLGTISNSSNQEDIAAAVAKQVGGDQELARDILFLKINPARIKPNARARAELKKSIQSIGQLEPITMWHPFGVPESEAIVVNGQTRKEILESLGVEPIIFWLPRNMPPTEILARRIHHELFATTKVQDQNVRDLYIEELLKRGINVEEITKVTGASRATIYRVLQRPDVQDRISGFQNNKSQEDDKNAREWKQLYDTGNYGYRDLAAIYRVSKDTIQRDIERISALDALSSEDDDDYDLSGMNSAEVKELLRKKEEEAEQARLADIEAKVSKRSPSTRPKTAKGKAAAAKAMEDLEDAIKRAGGGRPASTKTVMANGPGVRAAIFFSEKIRDIAVKALKDLGYTVTEP